MNKKRIAKVSIAVIAIAALTVAGVLLRARRIRATARVPAPEQHPWAVRCQAIAKGTAEDVFPCLATLNSAAETTINGQLAGTILEMGPREGVRVHRGDLLAKIDTRELDAQIERVRAEREAAKADAVHRQSEVGRERELLKAGGSTASRVEALETAALAQEAQVQALDRQIHSLEVRRGYATITSPVDGVVAERMAEVGNVCLPAHPLYRLTVARGARVGVRLPQGVLERIHIGTQVELRHGGKTLRIALDRVHPALDARALGVAEADLAEAPFGMPSGARLSAVVILDERRDALLVPRRAVLARGSAGKGGIVYRVVKAKPYSHLQAVRVAIDLVTRTKVAVVGDLQVGDGVVVARPQLLSRFADGDRVLVTSSQH